MPNPLRAISLFVCCALVAVGCSGDDDAADVSSNPQDATVTTVSDDADATTTTEAPVGGELSVLTYNVAGLPAEISTENPTEHIPLISPLLDAYDIVLTQEDFDWWGEVAAKSDFVNYHDRLRAAATQPYKTAKHPGPEAVGFDPSRSAPFIGDGQGIMSRFEFTGEQRVPWVGCFGGFNTSDGGAGDCLAMKGFAVVTVTLAPGIEVDVYSLHAEAGGTEEDQRLQSEDFVQLAMFIAGHSAGRAVILGGDTNLHTSPEHPDGGGTADSEIWAAFLAATGVTDACDATACADVGRIDKIVVRSSDAVDLEVTALDSPAAQFVDPTGEALSDHDPVVATISWRATSSR